ncbi:hypothetical protein V6N12_012769 [Hibiscus sabdariffa]|uniref:Uncharacterized protein n=1 Tax=Hibiscus sabdariffa TaxID=183260 RepID=A0ABR2EFC6_9ROSI
MVTPDYAYWIRTRINDTIPLPNQGQNIPMEDHLRVVPSEADMLRTELARVEDMIEKMGLQQSRDLFLAKQEVDKFAGEAEHATKKYSKLKIEYDIQNADFKKLEASVKHMELRKTPAEWRQEIRQAEERQKSLNKRELEDERENSRRLVENEKRKGKQTRDEYTELQAGRDKIERLEKEVKDLWELVQTCQINIQVLEDIKKGGNDYWFTHLRDAAHRFQEQDKINEKIMNLAQDVAEHVTALAREARILRPHVVSNEMKSSLELLFDQIKDLGIRVRSFLPKN